MSDADPTSISIQHYRWLLKRYGPSHHAVQWSSLAAQTRRFSVLSQYIDPGDSVVDLGCGLGAFFNFLERERSFSGRYLGLDCLQDFIEHCLTERPSSNRAQFELFDAGGDEYVEEYDWWVVSGMFNNLFQAHERHRLWVESVLRKSFAVCRTGLAFNGLSTIGATPVEGLYYQDPADVMRWCSQTLSENFICRHDYNPPAHESVAPDFTVYVFK